MRPIVKVVRR